MIFSTHNAYLANITDTKEPHTYAQAILDPNWQNQTWTLTCYLLGRNPSDANEPIK